MSLPRISVVIPTFNRSELIGYALDAVLAQQYPASEVIVVDDGSTDDTQALLAARYPSVRVVSVPNGGDTVARNVGLRTASCKIVAFCDSDDLWMPDYLAAMAALWASCPVMLTAYGNFQLVRNGIWDIRTKFDEAPPGFWNGLQRLGPGAGLFRSPVVDKLVRFQPFFPSCMTVNREAFLGIGGWDETVGRIIGCDFATALRAAEYPLGVLLPPLVGIRRHGGNISGDVMAMELGDAKVLEHVLKTRPNVGCYWSEIMASIADRRAAAADTAFDRRDFAAVLKIQETLPPSHQIFRRKVKKWISVTPHFIARYIANLISR